MKLSPAEIDKDGLALPPPSTDCLGENCTVTNRGETCFVDRHHLYFFKKRYDSQGPDSLPFKLRHDPFNIVPVARCLHDQIHNTYDGPYFPTDEVMEGALEKSAQLRDMGVSAIMLASLEQGLDAGNKFKPYKQRYLRSQRVPELMEAQREKIASLGKLVLINGLLPPELVADPLRVVFRDAPEEVRSLASLHMASTLLEAS